jgi:hypothetical protein
MKIIAWLLSAAILFAGSLPAANANTTKVIVLNVTKAGLVTSDVPISHDKRITLAKGTRVKLVFKFADKTHGAAHQFLLNSQGMEMTTPLLNTAAKEASMEFTVGSRNETFYRLSCLVPCVAMDNLVDYVILVDGTKPA